MVGENDVSVSGGGKFNRLKSSLGRLGVDKAKYQAKLIDYKQSQNYLLTEIYQKAQELAKYLRMELNETKEIMDEIGSFLEGVGKDAQAFDALANTIRTGESQSKSSKEQKLQAGGMQLKGNAVSSINAFKKRNKNLKKDITKIRKSLVKDEQDLKKVLVLLEYLRQLIKYYYEVDLEVKVYRLREVAISKKERIRIENETDEAAKQAGSSGSYDSSMTKKVDAGS